MLERKSPPLEWIETLKLLPNLRSFSLFVPHESHASVPLSIVDALVPALQHCPRLNELNLLFDVTFNHLRKFSRLPNVTHVTLGRASENALEAGPIKTWMKNCKSFGIFVSSSHSSQARIYPQLKLRTPMACLDLAFQPSDPIHPISNR